MKTYLSELCSQAEVQFRDCGNGHMQIIGAELVNYYPKSKRMTAYVAGGETYRNVSPVQAIELALGEPIVEAEESGKVLNHSPGKKSPTCATVFYDGDIPPWVIPGDFHFLCKEDSERYFEKFGVRHPWRQP